MAESEASLCEKIMKRKSGMEVKAMQMNSEKTKTMSGRGR